MTAPLALCDAASDLAHRVADLLSSPEQVAGTAHEAFAALPPELLQPAWQPASLLLGHSGIALLHTRCARNDARYAAVGHAHLAATATAQLTGSGRSGWMYADRGMPSTSSMTRKSRSKVSSST
ncbi:hypothetical protein ACFU5I_40835, partial [Streptomyces libani]